MYILYEDSCLIVCVKEAGLPVQSANLRTKDLESILRAHLAASSKPDDKSKSDLKTPEPYFLAPVNRLDQPVHGLVLFAKTKQAAARLQGQMESGKMRKYYLAGVRVEDAEGMEGTADAEGTEDVVLTDWLVRDGRTNTSRLAGEGEKGAKKAQLSYRVLTWGSRAGDRTALLFIHLITGRHHQIRVQLSGAGLPIIGDRKYSRTEFIHADDMAKSDKEEYKKSDKEEHNKKESMPGPTAPWLCAWRLSFLHPVNGKYMEFEVPREYITFLGEFPEAAISDSMFPGTKSQHH